VLGQARKIDRMQAETAATIVKQTSDAAAAPARPAIVTSLGPAEILARLDLASRRGRLPGFSAKPAPGVLFSLELHGRPFDGVLTATAAAAQGETRVEYQVRMLPRLPALFVVVLIATVWPGIYFVDRLIPGEWGWIPQIGTWWPGTWWWYIPITALPLPLLWRTLMRRSREGLAAALREALGKVAREVEGRIE
jgi:hypothetical protein